MPVFFTARYAISESLVITFSSFLQMHKINQLYQLRNRYTVLAALEATVAPDNSLSNKSSNNTTKITTNESRQFVESLNALVFLPYWEGFPIPIINCLLEWWWWWCPALHQLTVYLSWPCQRPHTECDDVGEVWGWAETQDWHIRCWGLIHEGAVLDVSPGSAPPQVIQIDVKVHWSVSLEMEVH